MNKPKAGLLLLFAGLYNSVNPEEKDTYKPFVEKIVRMFTANGIQIYPSEVCMYEAETREAIRIFQSQGVCAIVVLLLAYHPSLESASALTQSGLPVIILDTTMCYSFDPLTDPDMITWNHGIHGVQDLCCMLRRMRKAYMIEAGHYECSNVIARVSRRLLACRMADCFKKSRVGIIGEPFQGMGDFAFPFDEMERLTGIRAFPLGREKAASLMSSIKADELLGQIAKTSGNYRIGEGVEGPLLEMASSGIIALSRWADEEKLDAVTFNFLDFNRDLGLPAMPFAAVCELMAEGIGYAGEGDVLTAALVAALMKTYSDSTFTEMFCPDWKGNTVLMSHMGEANRKILKNPALVKIPMPYTPGLNAGVMPGVAGAYRRGKAVLVNLSPGPDGSFNLILTPCELAEPGVEDRFGDCVRGWMRTSLPLDAFLQEYSLLGGTHHSCLSYGADLDVLHAFGSVMGWHVHIIGG